MKNMKRLPAFLLMLVMLISCIPARAEQLPYDTYKYDYWQDIFRTPAAYVPESSVLGTDLKWNGENLGAFLAPQDLCVAPDGSIYLADTDNHRIVVMNGAMDAVLNVITGFDNAGLADQFNKPTGVAVTENAIYVADSMNRRIVMLNMDGTLNTIVEIPAAAAKQTIGKTEYAVGTYVEGMPELAKIVQDGENTYAAVNLAEGSAATVTNEAGLTYTVVAEAAALAPWQTTAERNGVTLTVTDKAAVTLTANGTETVITQYNPNPNPDLFMLIGRAVKLLKGSPAISYQKLPNVQGAAIDEDGDLYIGGEKGIVKLHADGEFVRYFASYKDEAGASHSLTTVSEFAVADNLLYIRDGENHIIVLDEDGDLVETIQSNAIRVTDGEGSEINVLTGFTGITGVDAIGQMLLVGQADGTVKVLDETYALAAEVPNDAVLTIDAQGEITQVLTEVAVDKTTERLAGLTGVALMDGKLCIGGANNRVLVCENGRAVHVAQNNCVTVTGASPVTGYTDANGAFILFDAVNGVEGVAMNTVCDGTKKANQRVQRQVVVSDSKDQNIVLDADLNVTRVVADPDSEVLEEGYVFTPLKVSVDYAGRIYCVAQNMFEGIMVFETNGEFTGFFGTIKVNISAWDKFWRKLATKEERSKQQLFIPTEFTGIDIDEEGFVYASNVDTAGTQAVRRLNPKGEDVIRMGEQANLGGDLWIEGTSQYAGANKIVDVVYREKGMYSLLDTKRGRIFTYDHEGNLLYIFGGLGTQQGTVTNPVAIEFAGDRILALDAKQASILVYKETEYGRLINEAVGLRYDGDESQAVALWEQVLRLDENNELANVGIGKAYLSAGDNETAMKYLKRGMSQDYYSVAFKRYRNEIFKENISAVLTGAVVLVAALLVWAKVIKPRIKKRGEGRA